MDGTQGDDDAGRGADDAPIAFDVGQRRVRRRHREADDVLACVPSNSRKQENGEDQDDRRQWRRTGGTFESGRDAVELAGAVDLFEQPFGEVVGTAQAEDDHAQVAFGGHLEAAVGAHHGLEGGGQLHAVAHVLLQALDAVVADDEPQLQRPEAPAQRDLPVLLPRETPVAVLAVIHWPIQSLSLSLSLYNSMERSPFQELWN